MAPPDPSPKERQKLRTLLVEDDPADHMVLRGLLARLPHWLPEPMQVGSLEESIKLLESSSPQLVLLDLNLPDSSGVETLTRFRESAPHIPLVVVSGMDDRDLSRQAVLAGAQDYVIKDELNTQVLLKAIDQAMARAALEEELRQSRRMTMESALLQQNEAIRSEIGGELHDVLSQNLTAMTLVLQQLRGQLEPGGLKNPALLDNLSGLLDQAIKDVARMSHGLYPPELERRGINQALEELALYTSSLHDIPCTFRGDEVTLEPARALHLYRIAQESISNAVKHASPGLIAVSLVDEGNGIRLEIRDDGCGFDVDLALPGLGRSTMSHRADALGATLRICSEANEGSKVSCHLHKT